MMIDVIKTYLVSYSLFIILCLFYCIYLFFVCVLTDGRLAQIDNQAENDFVAGLLVGNDAAWIGANDKVNIILQFK